MHIIEESYLQTFSHSLIYVYNDRLVITWYYSDDKTSIDLDALTEITETSESNTVDRVSTLLQSDPYTFLPYVLP